MLIRKLVEMLIDKSEWNVFYDGTATKGLSDIVKSVIKDEIPHLDHVFPKVMRNG